MLTVREAAARIKRPDESLDTAVNRLRSWTALGFVPAAGEKNPGSGFKRQYDSEGVLKAVVLQTLSDTYLGAPIPELVPIAKRLAKMVYDYRERDAYVAPLSARGHDLGPEASSMFFVFGEGKNGGFWITPVADLSQVFAKKDCDSYVLINIKRILERAEVASPQPTKRKGKD
jgi:hypothetical protein